MDLFNYTEKVLPEISLEKAPAQSTDPKAATGAQTVPGLGCAEFVHITVLTRLPRFFSLALFRLCHNNIKFSSNAATPSDPAMAPEEELVDYDTFAKVYKYLSAKYFDDTSFAFGVLWELREMERKLGTWGKDCTVKLSPTSPHRNEQLSSLRVPYLEPCDFGVIMTGMSPFRYYPTKSSLNGPL